MLKPNRVHSMDMYSRDATSFIAGDMNIIDPCAIRHLLVLAPLQVLGATFSPPAPVLHELDVSARDSLGRVLGRCRRRRRRRRPS